MNRLSKYEHVNSCESLSELADVIRSFADEDGMIQGRSRKFSAKAMADLCENFDNHPPNVLTREFGIRQQAMYLSYYSKV